MKVSRADLGPLTPLAQGAFGKVFRANAFTLAGDPTALAFKEFTVDEAVQARAARAAVEFRTSLSPADRADLDRFSAWPRALVTDGRDVCGLLMPLIPKEFFCQLIDADSGDMTEKPREMDWLIASQQQRLAARIDLGELDDTERLILMAQLVYIIGRLHKHGWVFGDLSFRNVVFAVDPLRVMLIDCDGAAALADPSRKQFSTPFWDPPECPATLASGQQRQQELQDAVTDTYKLGLAILRCLRPGKGASSTRAVSRLASTLDQEGTDLVTRALSADRDLRPTAKDLYVYLKRVVAPKIMPPEMVLARLATPFRPRGMDVSIEWHIRNAAELTIFAGNGLEQDVDLAMNPQGYSFRPAESGPVSIEARNRFGAVRADLGELNLYELPPFSIDLNYLPRPQVPALDAFSPEPLMATFAGRPLISVGTAEVPRVPSLSTLALVESLVPPGRTAVGWPHVSEAVKSASEEVTNLILGGEDDSLAATLRDAFARAHG